MTSASDSDSSDSDWLLSDSLSSSDSDSESLLRCFPFRSLFFSSSSVVCSLELKWKRAKFKKKKLFDPRLISVPICATFHSAVLASLFPSFSSFSSPSPHPPPLPQTRRPPRSRRSPSPSRCLSCRRCCSRSCSPSQTLQSQRERTSTLNLVSAYSLTVTWYGGNASFSLLFFCF